MKLTGSTTLAVGDVINLQIPVTGRVHDKENDEYTPVIILLHVDSIITGVYSFSMLLTLLSFL